MAATITKEEKIAYAQVLEVLNSISFNDYCKIPKEKIHFFKVNAEKNVEFDYNPDKTFQEQNISDTAKTIIAILFRDYWATEEQREKIIRVQQQERIRIEKEKQEKYKSNELFNNKKEKETQEVALVEVKELKWYKKIFDFFKKILKK